jgi:hypothetical protein
MDFSRLRYLGRRPASALRSPPRQTKRTRLPVLEPLETRTLPTGAHPYYVILPTGGSAGPLGSSGPTGYTPAQIRHAYGFDQIALPGGVPADGRGTTIAIVDAYDDPTIAGDLATFDAQFGLPNPAFTKVNQAGGLSYPPPDSGWASEIALDVEWAHAIAPAANILLVEAQDDSFTNLLAAVQFAAAQPGVVAVSMSWGGSEFSGENNLDGAFTTPAGHTGVTFVASSGDYGAPASFPAVSPNVLAVGGTSLYLGSGGTYGSESGWSGSGGGISALEPQPAYQKGVVTQESTRRANPDVAYDADPYTGFPVYDSFNNPAYAGWEQFGGTSDAAPQWAALIAIADEGRILTHQSILDGPSQTLPLLYGLSASDFHDITAGSSSGSPRESAGTGYDLVTGRGTPVANRIVADLIGSQNHGSNGGIPPPPTTNQPFIAAAYQNVLGRSATASERAAWQTLFDEGLTALQFAAALTHSTEYDSDFITGAYSNYFGRTPSSGELAVWVNLMQDGLTANQVEADFLSSPEYIQDHGGLGEGWVTAIYQDLLGRTPSQAELAGWTQALAGGMAPYQVAFAFTAGAEHEGQVVKADFQKYLGRAPSAAESAGWTSTLLQGAGNENLIANLVGSIEYFQKHTSG